MKAETRRQNISPCDLSRECEIWITKYHEHWFGGSKWILASRWVGKHRNLPIMRIKCIQSHSRSPWPGWLVRGLDGKELWAWGPVVWGRGIWMELWEWAQSAIFESHFCQPEGIHHGRGTEWSRRQDGAPDALTSLHHQPPQSRHWARGWNSPGAEMRLYMEPMTWTPMDQGQFSCCCLWLPTLSATETSAEPPAWH